MLDRTIVIDWRDPFMSEAGIMKPFKDFAVGDAIRHVHRGCTEPERNASAKVFRAGFRCFVCNESYFVMDIMEEDVYEFRDGEVEESDDPGAWLQIDWGRHLATKFSVTSAPMGSGKQTCPTLP
jgi:hypothetical protein